MIANAKEITADEMFLEWGRAEMCVDRLEKFLAKAKIDHASKALWRETCLPLIPRIAADDPLTERERQSLVTFMRDVSWRGDDVSFFTERAARWYRVDFALSDVGDVLLDGYFGRKHWDPPPPPRTVSDFARHPQGQGLTLTGDFALSKVRGCPIYVAPRLGGPWCMAEGSNRSRALWISFQDGKLGDQTMFPAIVGVHPDAEQWIKWPRPE